MILVVFQKIKHRNFKNIFATFLKENFKYDSRFISQGDIGSLQATITKNSNKEALFKTGVVRVNNTQHVTWHVRKKILSRSRLTNNASKSEKIRKY